MPGSLGTLAYLVPTSAGVKLSPGLPWSYRQRFATAIAQHLGELPYLRLSLGEVLNHLARAGAGDGLPARGKVAPASLATGHYS